MSGATASKIMKNKNDLLKSKIARDYINEWGTTPENHKLFYEMIGTSANVKLFSNENFNRAIPELGIKAGQGRRLANQDEKVCE